MRTHHLSNVEPENIIEPIKHSHATNEWEENQGEERACAHAAEHVPWYYDPLVDWNDTAPSQRQSECINQHGNWTET